jgi:hypothetical protein
LRMDGYPRVAACQLGRNNFQVRNEALHIRLDQVIDSIRRIIRMGEYPIFIFYRHLIDNDSLKNL